MDLNAIATDALQEIETLMDSTDGWKVVKTTDGFTVESQPSPHFEGTVYRNKGVVNAPFQECFKYLDVSSGSSRYEWDTDSNKVECVEEINADTKLQWGCSHSIAMGLISPRDSFDLVKVKKTDNSIVFTALSVTGDAYPAKAGFVRSNTYPSGIRLVQDQKDANKTHLTGIMQADLGGRLPKSLIESTMPSLQVSMNKAFLAHMKKVGVSKD